MADIPSAAAVRQWQAAEADELRQLLVVRVVEVLGQVVRDQKEAKLELFARDLNVFGMAYVNSFNYSTDSLPLVLTDEMLEPYTLSVVQELEGKEFLISYALTFPDPDRDGRNIELHLSW